MHELSTLHHLTMSSQEIADLVEKRHDNVKRTIERLSDKNLVTFTQIEEPTKGGGKPTTVYHVNKRDSYVVVAQLSPEFTARLVDRWQELENKANNLPNFTNPAEAAIAWAKQYQESERLQLELKAKNEQIEADKPLTTFAKIVAVSNSPILIGNYVTALHNNHSIDIGQNRLFEWLRENGYLCKIKGEQWNRPTQKSINLGLFVSQERVVAQSNSSRITFTPKLTGKGQIYFAEKLIAEFGKGVA